MHCYTLPTPTFGIFAEGVPPLLYYSHIPIAIICLLIAGFLVYRKSSVQNWLIMVINGSFATWCIMDLVVWTNTHSNVVLFTWSLLGLVSGITAVASILFVYTFLYKANPSNQLLVTLSVLLLPLILLTPTAYNLGAFDLELCGSSGYEGHFYVGYRSFLGLVAIVWIMGMYIHKYSSFSARQKAEAFIMTSGISFFLALFFFMSLVASYLNDVGAVSDYSIEQYGLFGMLFFVIVKGYLLVRFDTFNVKILDTKVFVLSLWVLIASLLFVVRSPTSFFMIVLTLIVSVGLGLFLIKSVNREITNREKGEQLARYLANANARLRELDRQKTEFVSIASHQLRAPIAAITGYASLLADGSYGPMPEPMREPLFRIFESGKRIAIMVDDFLNVTRMEQGRMTYATLPVDICKVVRDVTAEITLIADNRSLALEVLLPDCPEKQLIVTGDEGKLKQVLSNLIDNAVKYTKAGFVRVSVSLPENKHSVLINITDSGIGIAPEEIPNLFAKFTRATNANDATVTGTGLGLYIAKEIVKAHNGWIHVSSPGVGKGTTFTIELPLAKEEK